MKTKNNLQLGLLIFSVLVLDQLTKFIAVKFFEISCNRGGAFGISGNFAVISILVLIVVLWLFLKEKNRLNLVALSLVFSGGFSNLIDRFTVGCVRDFVDFKVFPSFNLADTAITVGAILIFYNLIFANKDEA